MFDIFDILGITMFLILKRNFVFSILSECHKSAYVGSAKSRKACEHS